MPYPLAALALATALAAGGAATAQDPYRDNVVVILDASGSMAQNMKSSGAPKIDAAKEALVEALRRVPAGTSVGILVFSARNLKSDWVYPLGPVDRARLESAARLPLPGRSTPLGAYLKKGADALLAAREKQLGYGTFRLLVVTDGEASDPGLVNAFLPDILSRGINVDVIGVDMKGDHALATRVHSYRRADDPAALASAVSAVFAEISSTRDDTTADDAFEMIAPIPDAMAQAMIGALQSSGNHPIGERPRAIEDAEPSPARERSQPPAPSHSHGHRSRGLPIKGILVAAMVVLVVCVAILQAFVRAGRRAQRHHRDRRRR